MAVVLLDLDYQYLERFIDKVLEELENVRFCGASGDSTDDTEHMAHMIREAAVRSKEKMT